jgi:hypothetical protein
LFRRMMRKGFEHGEEHEDALQAARAWRQGGPAFRRPLDREPRNGRPRPMALNRPIRSAAARPASSSTSGNESLPHGLNDHPRAEGDVGKTADPDGGCFPQEKITGSG